MPIRPIDTLSMPSRSQEASQVKHVENQKMTQAHEQMGAQYNSSLKHDSQQTVNVNKSENHEYRYSDGKKNNSEAFSQKKRKKKSNQETEAKKEIKKNGFDIRI
ncbi:MAG: hypothetical protein PWP24_1074 [Clostridiales bacterium]|nr:hypothetical protein [Clostridiales bacterium]